jgi:putative zinc finger/helix-turn-helix YgiT family protein
MKTLPFCPFCETEGKLVVQREKESISIRGEEFPVEVEYYRCEACGEQFENTKQEIDPLEEAYREYRRRKNMVTPEEMRDFRKNHGLTQEEFSRLLGMGVTTLNRYENGALQTEAHDRILRLVMEPGNLLKLVQRYPDTVQSDKLNALLAQSKPESQPEGGYSGAINLHVPRSLHRQLVKEATQEGVTLNQYINVALSNKLSGIKTTLKTQDKEPASNWPGLSLATKQALRMAGLEEESGQYDERLFADWLGRMLSLIESAFTDGATRDAIRYLENTTVFLRQHMDRSPIFETLVSLFEFYRFLLENVMYFQKSLMPEPVSSQMNIAVLKTFSNYLNVIRETGEAGKKGVDIKTPREEEEMGSSSELVKQFRSYFNE